MKKSITGFTLLVVLLGLSPNKAVAQDVSEKAIAFLQTLDEEVTATITFPFDNSERFNWHFIPRERKGVNFHSLSESQKAAGLALLRASLSGEGMTKTQEIIELENVLRIVENRPSNDTYRDPDNYYFSIFGTPGSRGEWGWRFEGHHISLNFSSARGTITSATPSFFGSNPAIVQVDLHRGRQVLKRETDLGFDLLWSLNETQQAKAIYTDQAPHDILTSNDRHATLQTPQGIGYRELTEDQKQKLMALIEVYLQNYTSEVASALRAKLQAAGVDEIHFAWAGSKANAIGQPHYYRIQNPALLIEYDNVQNNANHVHTVLRDLTNDFGVDHLGAHYLHGHSHTE